MEYYFVFDGLVIISLIIILISQIFVSSSYHKYSKIANKRKITGAEACRYLLDKNGLNDIYVVETSGYLTDHYDPTRKVIKLSSNVYNSASIGAVAVASHECGHALQDKENYRLLHLRNKLIPIVNFSSSAGYFALLLGFVFSLIDLIWIGIGLQVVILIFQLVTLPIEINASNRALNELDYAHLLNSNELSQGKIMLTAAAFTYVVSVATTLIQILRLVLLFGRRDD